jgi:hypothetical protein
MGRELIFRNKSGFIFRNKSDPIFVLTKTAEERREP